MRFSEILIGLPAVDHVCALVLHDGATQVARIENQRGHLPAPAGVCLLRQPELRH